ncbi:MAG: hypothetical protein FD167_2072, partial [bacterium]
MKRNSFRWLIFGLMITVLFNVIGLAQSNGDPVRGEQLVSLARQALGGEARLNEIQGLGLEGKINRPGQVQDKPTQLKLMFMTHSLAGVPGQINEDVEFNVSTDGPQAKGKVRVFKDDTGKVHKIDEERVVIFKNDADREQKVNSERVVIVTEKGAKELSEGDTKIENDVVISGVSTSSRATILLPVDLAQSMIGLLLKSPLSVEFNYIGDAENGTADAISIKDKIGFSGTLLLDKATHLPIGLNYFGSYHEPIFVHAKKGEKINIEGLKKRVEVKEDPKTEISLRFTDHRIVDGVLLPHRITRAVNGEVKEEYE